MNFHIVILVLPPMLFALANLIDKYLVTGESEDSRPGALIAISGAVNIITAACVLTWSCGLQGNPLLCTEAIPLMLNGGTYMLAIYIYLYALQTEEASRVVPWFQLIPAFGVVGGGLVLNEYPSLLQSGSILAVMIGGWVMTTGHGLARAKFSLLMILSAVLLAVNDVVFANFGREIVTGSAVGYDMFGKACWGMIPLMFHAGSRRGFVLGIRTRFGLQMSSEMLSIVADALLDIAKITIPVVVVQAVCATQPAFVLIGAIVLTIWLPGILKEEIGYNHVVRKVIATMLTIVGGIGLAWSVR